MVGRDTLAAMKLLTSIAFVLLGGCSFQASCNGGHTLNSKNAEALVKKDLAAQTGREPTVHCPDKVKIEQGGRFDCQVTVDGVPGVVTIEQKDDKTNVEVVEVSGFLIAGKLEGVLVERLQAQSGAKVKVDCGPRVRPSTPGDVFRCQAGDDAGTAVEIEVKVKDKVGNVSFDVVVPAAAPGTPPVETPPPAPTVP